jgi:putative ABC transport system ATP-binding protein
MGCLDTPDGGSYLLDGQEVAGLDDDGLSAIRNRKIGFVFQSFNLLPRATALENVELPLIYRDEGGIKAKAAAALASVGLADRTHHKPTELSGGQQQRVAIARALALDPSLVLADEPTAHLDFVQVEEVLKLIRTLASTGRTVVVSTHDERMVPLADQVIEMVPKFRNDLREPEQVTLGAGATLFRQGEPAELVYFVESGEVEIVRELVDGGEERLATIGPGNYFGEIGPMLGLARSATARARSDSALLGFTVRSFRERVGADGVRGLVETDPA